MSWRDLAALVDRTAAKPFATPIVQYRHDPGGPNDAISDPGEGVYEAAGQRAVLVGGVEVLTTQPQLRIHADRLDQEPAQGDEVVLSVVTAGDTTLYVEAWEIDGPGVSYTLWLISGD